MGEMITSISNPIVKYVKSLHNRRGRWKNQSYFVEGVRSVEESIFYSNSIQYIIYSDLLFNVKGGKDLFELLIKNNCKLYYVSDKILKEISDTENPQGVIAVIRFDNKSISDLLKEKENFLVLLDRIQDPGNMGTIIRTAEAFGANGIVLTSGCVDIYNPKVIRATMGSIFRLPLSFTNNVISTLEQIKQKGVKIISSSLDTDKFCYDSDLKEEFILVIGNEGSGVSQDILKISDQVIKIPMIGKAESLNASVAASIIMYEALRQRQNF